MSILSDRTEYQVLKTLKKCLKLLEDTDKMKMTKTDDFEVSLAKNMLRSIIDSNSQPIDLNNI